MCCSCKGTVTHLEYVSQSNKRVAIESAETFSITKLPKDVITLILKPFQKSKESPFIRLVCKQWKSIVSFKKFNLKTIAKYYAKRANLTALKFLEQLSTKTISNLFAEDIGQYWFCGAAQSGSMEMIEWATSESSTLLSPLAFKYAARSGNLQLVKWFKEQNIDFFYDILCEAAKSGNEEVVTWLLENGAPMHGNACICAAEAGNFEIAKILYFPREELGEAAAQRGNIAFLEWLVEKSNRLDLPKCGIKAAEKGQIETLKWLKSKGWKIKSGICDIAANTGRIDLMEWLKDNGAEFSETTMAIAARTNFDLVKWLRVNGCPWSIATTASAAYYGTFETFKWLYENSCPCQFQSENFDTKTIHASKLVSLQQFDILKYLWLNEKIYLDENCYICGIKGNSKKLIACKLLYSMGCPYGPKMWEVAVKYQALEVLEWLKSINCPYIKLDDYCNDATEWLENNGYQVAPASARTREFLSNH